MIHKVYNTEGYTNNIQGYYGPNYQYYRKDHLGNIREVWRATTNQTIQNTCWRSKIAMNSSFEI